MCQRAPHVGAQAFAMGLDIDPDHAALRDGLQGVSEDLTGDDLRKVMLQCEHEPAARSHVLPAAAASRTATF